VTPIHANNQASNKDYLWGPFNCISESSKQASTSLSGMKIAVRFV
jgi:hypothetical protein